jgi:hypothetical protein
MFSHGRIYFSKYPSDDAHPSVSTSPSPVAPERRMLLAAVPGRASLSAHQLALRSMGTTKHQSLTDHGKLQRGERKDSTTDRMLLERDLHNESLRHQPVDTLLLRHIKHLRLGRTKGSARVRANAGRRNDRRMASKARLRTVTPNQSDTTAMPNQSDTRARAGCSRSSRVTSWTRPTPWR